MVVINFARYIAECARPFFHSAGYVRTRLLQLRAPVAAMQNVIQSGTGFIIKKWRIGVVVGVVISPD